MLNNLIRFYYEYLKIHYVIIKNFIKLDWESCGLKINGENLSHLRFADDLVNIASSTEELETMLNNLIGFYYEYLKIHYVIIKNFIKLDWESCGLKINGENLSHLRFADDLVNIASSTEELETMLNNLIRFYYEYLKIHYVIIKNFIKLDWESCGLKINGENLSHLRFADDLVNIASSTEELETMLNNLIGFYYEYLKIHYVIIKNFIKLDWESCGLKINGENLSHLRFADDLVNIASSTEELETMLNNLIRFNAEKRPKPLCNWEVPRWAPARPRPAELRPPCKPIVDDRGHFLPGVPRSTSSRCHGHYLGTWQLPRRITRELAQELSRQPPPGRYNDWLHPRVQRPRAAAARLRGKKHKPNKTEDTPVDKFVEDLPAQEIERTPDDEQQPINNTEEKELDKFGQDKEIDLFDRENKKEPVDQSGHGPYIPGSVTEPEKRHDSYNILEKKVIEEIHGPQENETDKFWRKVAENAKENGLQEQEADEMKDCNKKYKENLKLPAVNVHQNFEFARKMRVGNLEHQPLPDTMGYRNLTKIGEHRDSDIVVKPYAIGWKGYGASGPTCCTKMRVHRPKTCDAKKSEHEKAEDSKLRPSTSAPDLGRKIKKPLSLMDLAICWDYRPDDPKQEPKPPKHVDGSNGSKAPAVFTMVHTPKDNEDEPIKSGHCNPIFNQNRVLEDVGRHPVPYFEKDMTKEKRSEACDVQYCPQHEENKSKNNNANNKNNDRRNSKSNSGTRRNSMQSDTKAGCDGVHGCGTPSEVSRKSSKDHSERPEKLAEIKQAWGNNNMEKQSEKYDFNRNRPSLESYDKTSLAQGKLHQSSPNDSQLSRRSTKEMILANNNAKHKHCTSCNSNSKPHAEETKIREDYKFAFKAGNPNSVQNSNTSNESKNLKIPKMRHPYSKKSYSIPTLAPPFSVWKDASCSGYPEHWRLASVYQHAYKPPEQRRKPLIASIYE